ncbi:MAG: hypothetical protein ACUVSC_05215 [Candidatus Fervidibacter sp.]|uniref:hypothetical protein n=1 Tax=Candidatus Fervidibacter sp. TaxID=3100871 RepID=UPI0040492DCD
MSWLRVSGIWTVAGLLLWVLPLQAWAMDHYVRMPNPSCGVNLLSIQKAIDHVGDGDTIIVGRGIYSERITINKNNLTVMSSGGPNRTFIRPPELVPAGVLITGNENLFEGFTVEDRTFNRSQHPHAHRLIFVQGDKNRWWAMFSEDEEMSVTLTAGSLFVVAALVMG